MVIIIIIIMGDYESLKLNMRLIMTCVLLLLNINSMLSSYRN